MMRVLRIITFLLLLYTINVSADLSIRYDLVNGARHIPFHSILIQRDLLRINRDIDQSMALLVNLRDGDIVQLHNPSKRFFQTNIQTIDQYVTFYKQNRTLLQGLIDQGMTQLVPQQREQLQQFLDQYKKPASANRFNIRVTGQHKQVLGTDCSVIAVYQEKTLKSEVCMASYPQLDLHTSDINSLEQIKRFIQQFKQSAPKQHQQIFTLLAHPAAQMDGIPMQVIDYQEDGKIRNIIQAAKISLRLIPSYNYRIPANFQPSNFPIL